MEVIQYTKFGIFRLRYIPWSFRLHAVPRQVRANQTINAQNWIDFPAMIIGPLYPALSWTQRVHAVEMG